jgi:hypothetical protein
LPSVGPSQAGNLHSQLLDRAGLGRILDDQPDAGNCGLGI